MLVYPTYWLSCEKSTRDGGQWQKKVLRIPLKEGIGSASRPKDKDRVTF
jgi:hypothetical protein